MNKCSCHLTRIAYIIVLKIQISKQGLEHMKINIRNAARYAYGLVAGIVFAVILLPFTTQLAAAAQVTSRGIEMSTSAASATSVSYSVTFTPATTVAAGGGIVVDICDNDPIIGDTSCTSPAGFDWGGATPSLTVNSGMGSGWTAAGVQGGAGAGKSQVLELSASTGTLTAATPANFTITTVTNPSTSNHSFYARIVTFDTAAHMSNYTVSTTTRASSFSGEVDYGGIALSTASLISITATVQETLTFCVSGTDLTASTCSSATAPTITIGNGTPPTLETASVDTANAYTQISTNASSGATVRMKAGYSSCAGLSRDSGTTCGIPGMSNTSAAAMSSGSSSGNADFGLYVSTGTLSATGSGSSVADANYHNASHTTIPSDLWYGMDNTNVTSTYGDVIFATGSSPAPCSLVNNQLVFAATAALTTPSGVYSGTEALIATGVF